MNARQAQREARSRWGALGYAVKAANGQRRVGYIQGGMFFVEGVGDNWTEAFRDAIKKFWADRERYAKIKRERESSS